MGVTDVSCASGGEPDAAGAAGAGFVGAGVQERAWLAAEGVAVEAMGAVNAGVARLVAAVGGLLATDGWVGPGVRSPEHWVAWKAGVSAGRARGLVAIARRAGELPACMALFAEGRLGEDAMVRIARRVPGCRDAEIAGLAPRLLISQLDRLLAALPEVPDGTPGGGPGPGRACRLHDSDGWTRGTFCVPADEGAVVRAALVAARDAERRDRHGGDPGERRGVGWADGLVRMATETVDALDATHRRTGHRGEGTLVVLHHDVDPHGALGPAQIDLGPTVPPVVARFLSCDARVQVLSRRAGALVGINPAVRTVERAMRRHLTRRDQGCVHPLCTQRLWLHAHHIVHWEHGGPTTADNLALLCPTHHRALHHGRFHLHGNPETGTLRALDPWGNPLTPPPPPDPDQRPPPPPAPFTPPTGEPLHTHNYTWN